MYVLYDIGLGLFLLLGFPLFLYRGLKTGKYLPTFWERMGRIPERLHRPPAEGSIWIHAVSVGEVLTSRKLCLALKKTFPDRRITLSTTTLAGHAVALQNMAGWDDLFCAPFDFPFSVRKALGTLNPRLLVLVETELWPNLIREARRRGTRIAVVNGRISHRSFPRYRRIRFFLTRVLSEVDLFLMQAQPHADRLIEMGAPPDRVRVTGNLKFDALEPPAPSEGLRGLLAGSTPLVVAGSTVEGEEEILLQVYRQILEVHPDTRLLVAPRHPERFPLVPPIVEAAGLRCLRRTEAGDRWPPGSVLVLDTLGELAQAYSFATLAFVGGSLVPRGGHNILEAAVAGKAVIVGPHMENFQEIADLFSEASALVRVADAAGLRSEMEKLLGDPVLRAAMGERARALVRENHGALEGTLAALEGLVA